MTAEQVDDRVDVLRGELDRLAERSVAERADVLDRACDLLADELKVLDEV